MIDTDYKNIYQLAKWCMDHDIRLKILERVTNDNSAEEIVKSYLEMKNRLVETFGFTVKKDKFNQVQCFNDKCNRISFFHSHCRENECILCNNLSQRIGVNGEEIKCLFKSEILRDKIKNIL